MIVTIIVILFAIFYWLFSVSFLAIYMQEEVMKHCWLLRLVYVIEILMFAPVFVPIVLGIDISSNIYDEICD